MFVVGYFNVNLFIFWLCSLKELSERNGFIFMKNILILMSTIPNILI